MAILSMRSRKRALEVAGAGLLCASAFLLQTLVLNRFYFNGVICSLPLTIVIVWGLVFGSPLPPITALELRKKSTGEIFRRQLAAGSPGGLLMGLFLACLYSETVPTFPVTLPLFGVVEFPAYPLAFPLVGWIAGYLCLRKFSQGNLLCIPLTFVLTLAAECLMSWELVLLRRTGVFEHLAMVVFPEAMINAIIAPFIYFPLRQWYEISEGQRASLAME